RTVAPGLRVNFGSVTRCPLLVRSTQPLSCTATVPLFFRVTVSLPWAWTPLIATRNTETVRTGLVPARRPLSAATTARNFCAPRPVSVTLTLYAAPDDVDVDPVANAVEPT